MGSGASSAQKLNMKQERANEEAARQLFSQIAKGETLAIVDIYEEAQKHGKAVKAYWTMETIERVLAKYDSDKDGRITCDEYLAALRDMMDRPAEAAVSDHVAKLKRKSKKGRGSERSSDSGGVTPMSPMLKRQWTWKKFDEPERSKQRSALEELEEFESASAKALPNMKQLEEQFWEKQQEETCWSLPLRRDRAQMPWLKEDETGLTAAVEQAKKLGKTALLLEEDLNNKPIEDHYRKAIAIISHQPSTIAIAIAITVTITITITIFITIILAHTRTLNPHPHPQPCLHPHPHPHPHPYPHLCPRPQPHHLQE